jgi:hypothetical protein
MRLAKHKSDVKFGWIRIDDIRSDSDYGSYLENKCLMLPRE